MKQGITLIPAFGRRYATQEEMIRDWNAGKDFRVWQHGPYTNNQDEERLKQMYGEIVLFQALPHLRAVVAAKGSLI